MDAGVETATNYRSLLNVVLSSTPEQRQALSKGDEAHKLPQVTKVTDSVKHIKALAQELKGKTNTLLHCFCKKIMWV